MQQNMNSMFIEQTNKLQKRRTTLTTCSYKENVVGDRDLLLIVNDYHKPLSNNPL